MNTVSIGNISIGNECPLLLVAGPCVIENENNTLKTAETLKTLTEKIGMPFIFKSSYDKANRSSVSSFRGPGIDEGLRILKRVKDEVGIPVLSDVHTEAQIDKAQEVLDVIQVPAFLCRQTDLLVKAGKTGLPINIKKGQFMAPWDMKNVAGKVLSTGNKNIIFCERGASFGYNNLVSDMRSIPLMQQIGFPVIFDGTHSVQIPGGLGDRSGGERDMATYLTRAAVAAGCDGVFLEVHECPDQALCDGPNMLALNALEPFLVMLQEIRNVIFKH